jgi:TolA-binding protein
MEVRCDRCKTECKLESAQIAAGTVQCSDCGHIIVLTPSGPSTPPPDGPITPPPENVQWLVETVHGRSLSGPDVATLHRWIIERRVTREDRISLGGRPWQRIGDVPELLAFFDIAESAERSRRADSPGPMMVASPQLVPPMTRPVSAVMPSPAQGVFLQAAEQTVTTILVRRTPWRFRLPFLLVVMGGVAALVAFAGIALVQRLARSRDSVAIAQPQPEPAPTAEPGQPEPAAVPVIPPAEIAPIAAPEVKPLAEDKPKALPPMSRKKARLLARSGRSGKTAAASAVLTKAPGPSATGGPSPQIAAAQGYAALNRKQFPQAIELFKQAIAGNPRNGTALFGLAEAYRESKNRKSALKAYQRYIAVMPSGPNAGEARLQIRLLEGKSK